MRKLLLTTASLFALLAVEAAAQPITDFIVVDRPTLVVQDSRFQAGVSVFHNQRLMTGRAGPRLRSIEELVDATYGGREIIQETLGLDDVPQLQFDRLGNKAGVEQDGIHNLADVDQLAARAAWAIVNQLGEDSSTQVIQRDSLPGPSRLSLNRAYVGQVSFDTRAGPDAYFQTAIINQTYSDPFGGNVPNHAAIQQGGIRALAEVDGASPLSVIGWNNTAEITQFGSGHDAVIQQGAENAILFSLERADTLGQNNWARVAQSGFDNTAVVSQEDDSTASVLQYGFNNQAFTHQDGAPDLAENSSEIEQGLAGANGSGNFAAVLQLGYNARSRVVQETNDNIAVVEQTFRAAEADSFINQRGLGGNFVSVLQDVGVSYNMRLISVVLQDGSANYAAVRQTNAPGSSSSISQRGDNNFAEVSQ